MSAPELVTPIVHLNGTSAEALTGQLAEVAAAVHTARRLLDEAAPNGRDYYPEPGRFEKAMAQHRWRQEQLDAVYRSLLAETEVLVEWIVERG